MTRISMEVDRKGITGTKDLYDTLHSSVKGRSELYRTTCCNLLSLASIKSKSSLM